MNNIIQQLAADFAAVFDGKPWYGSNYRQLISDITPEEALELPANGHSIVRILWHMVKWRKALSERLLGNTSYRTSDGDPDNWRDTATLDAQSWDEAKKQYDALQEVIVSELRLRNDAFLDIEFLPGKTYRWLAFGVLHHDLYHLGQIALLKNIIRAKN
ncbi:MAG: DinB family protein [Saprospiraceae bacterium]|nr:MAG: DinB family protein [Saprospiraceae bacterium]